MVDTVIPVEQARQIVLENVGILPSEAIDLNSSPGRFLAEDVAADSDMPPFDRARMDGYALKANDVLEPGAVLEVIGAVAAGEAFGGVVSRGQAVRIMTGAPVPAGADAVQRFEVTEEVDGRARINETIRVGQNIGRRGSEARGGETVIPRGTRITPAEIAVLASFGYARVRVTRRPTMALFATGSELVEVAAKPSTAQIRNSNSHALAGYAKEAGIDAADLGIIPDDEDRLRRAIGDALDRFDVVALSGGVSMGDYDLVKAVLKELGAQVFFDKVCIHPGKPTVFARRGERIVFALPGNPVSMAVTFLMFAYPALLRMQGAAMTDLPVVMAQLAQDVRHNPDRRSYLPGRFQIKDGRVSVAPVKWTGSSDLVAFRRANALLVIRENVEKLSKGEAVETVLLPGTRVETD